MPDQKVKLKVSVVPELSQRDTSSLKRQMKDLRKDLGKIDVSWQGLAKTTSLNIREINKISSAVGQFSKNLSKAAQDSFKKLSDLSGELEDAEKKAADLGKEYKSAKGPRKEDLSKDLGKTEKIIEDLNKQIIDQKNETKKFTHEVLRATAAQKKNIDTLQKAANYNPKDVFRDIVDRVKSGDIKGTSGVTGIIGSLAKGAQGSVARSRVGKAESVGGSEGAGMMASMGGAITAMTAGMAAVAAIVKLIMMASDHMTDLNKALLAGGGFVNDFVGSAKNYRGVVDQIRNASIDMRSEVMKYGMTSEDVLKTISSYSQESTGSLIKTRDTLKRLGSGDVQVGMKDFAETAQVYGKALGMEATDVASMMGKFQSEAGYGADQVQQLMGNVVQAAATANMPMTKFLDVFRQVIPSVELYQNRIEELTGTIKLLSKTMSAKDIKNFEEAFSRGFQGTDLKQRIKTMFIAGQGNVSSALEADFRVKAQTLGKSFEKYLGPDASEQMVKAMKGGEGAMADLLTKAQAEASKAGEALPGEQISNAMKLAGFEGDRQKGGLDLATAMLGAGQLATYKILKSQAGAFVKGYSGLSEAVIKQTGITEQQYEALRTMDQSMKTQRKMLDRYGKTNSKSMNKELRELIASRKGIKAGEVTAEDMKKATEDDLFAAAERSNDDKKTGEKAKDLAVEQYKMTSSISDKLDNYIGFILEKIYQVLDHYILGAIEKVTSWLMGGSDHKDDLKALDSLSGNIKKWNKDLITKTPDAGSFIDSMTDSVSKGLSEGKSGDDLAAFVANSQTMSESLKSLDEQGQKSLAQQVGQMGEAYKMSATDSATMQNAFYAALKKGDMAGAISSMKDMPGKMSDNIMYLAQRMVKTGAYSSNKLADVFHRPGAAPVATYKSQSELDLAKQVSDIDVLDESGGTPAALSAGVPAGAAPISTPAPASTVQTADQKAASDAHLDQTDHLESVAKSQEQQVDQTDDIYKGVDDTLSLLKKGVKFEQSWMSTKFKNVLKEASLDALRPALSELLVGYAKISSDSGLRDALAKYGDKLLGANAVTSGLSGIDVGGNAEDTLSKLIPSHAQGIASVPYNTPAMLHAGEQVVSAPNARKGNSGKVVNVTIYAQGVPASQIAHHVSAIARSD